MDEGEFWLASKMKLKETKLKVLKRY